MKLAVLAVLAAAAVSLLVPATSSASPYIRFGVQDDAYLFAGPSLQSRLDTLDRMGAQLVRYTVNWRQVARTKPRRAANPKDPAYDWTNADAVLKGLHDRKIGVIVTLYGTPGWAKRRPRRKPRTGLEVLVLGVRARRRAPLPVGAAVGDLERAEPAPLPQAELAATVRATPAQPDVCGAEAPALLEPRRRRRDLASADA